MPLPFAQKHTYLWSVLMISRGAGDIDKGSGNGRGTVKERSRGVFPVPGAPGSGHLSKILDLTFLVGGI